MRELSILTLNIRRDRGDDGINNWEYRKDLVAGMFQRCKPDVAVFQEVLVHQLRDLTAMLPDYAWVGVGRDDGAEAGEFAPIFSRGLSAKRHGTFWLSDTPDVPSRTWPGMTRICTWAEFSGDVPFAVFNVHLEYEFESTQMRSVELLRRRLDVYPVDLPVFITGDFNFNPGSAPYNALGRFAQDSFRPPRTGPSPNGKPVTCHDFTGRTDAPPSGAWRIDYIWHRGDAEIANYRILTDKGGTAPGVYISDHWPVMCTVLLP